MAFGWAGKEESERSASVLNISTSQLEAPESRTAAFRPSNAVGRLRSSADIGAPTVGGRLAQPAPRASRRLALLPLSLDNTQRGVVDLRALFGRVSQPA